MKEKERKEKEIAEAEAKRIAEYEDLDKSSSDDDLLEDYDNDENKEEYLR